MSIKMGADVEKNLWYIGRGCLRDLASAANDSKGNKLMYS